MMYHLRLHFHKHNGRLQPFATTQGAIMNARRLSFLIFLILIPAFLFAQASAENQMLASDYYSAVDANGRTVKLNEKPVKVLIAGKAGNMPANALFLFPEVEDMDLTLPLTDQGLGDFFAFIRPSLHDTVRISQNASVEEIASREPQLVLTKATHFESIAKKLDQLGVPNFTLNLESYEDWQKEIVQLGKLLKNTKRAEQILSMYENRLLQVTSKVSTLSEVNKKRVLLLQGARGDNANSFKIAPDTWMQTWMVETIGATPVWKGANSAANGWSTVSFEQIAAWNPEVMYIVSYKTPSDSFIKEIYNSPLWADLDAVKNHQVKQTPSDMMNYIQPVASWILGVEWMAKDLYPSLFPTMDMEKQIASFYHDFYSIKDEAMLEELQKRYKASISLN